MCVEGRRAQSERSSARRAGSAFAKGCGAAAAADSDDNDKNSNALVCKELRDDEVVAEVDLLQRAAGAGGRQQEAVALGVAVCVRDGVRGGGAMRGRR